MNSDYQLNLLSPEFIYVRWLQRSTADLEARLLRELRIRLDQTGTRLYVITELAAQMAMSQGSIRTFNEMALDPFWGGSAGFVSNPLVKAIFNQSPLISARVRQRNQIYDSLPEALNFLEQLQPGVTASFPREAQDRTPAFSLNRLSPDLLFLRWHRNPDRSAEIQLMTELRQRLDRASGPQYLLSDAQFAQSLSLSAYRELSELSQHPRWAASAAFGCDPVTIQVTHTAYMSMPHMRERNLVCTFLEEAMRFLQRLKPDLFVRIDMWKLV